MDFILVALEHAEELVDADVSEFFRPMPEHAALGLREFKIGFEDGEIDAGSTAAELVFPRSHFFSAPTTHATIVDAQCRIWHHEVLVDADDHAETLATLAGAEGGIEGKHAIGRFAKDDAVGLEARGEMMEGPRRIETQEAFTVALVESGLNGVVQAGDGIFVVADAEAVDEE